MKIAIPKHSYDKTLYRLVSNIDFIASIPIRLRIFN